MTTRNFLIIYGAAVKPEGEPSGSLRRRVEGAWQISQRLKDPCLFIVTGGVGEYPPSEAKVMQRLLLELGATAAQIILEDQATDTMESSFNCAEILVKHKFSAENDLIVNCSSPYHNYRCQLLLHMLGFKSLRGNMPSDRPALGIMKWLRYYFREMLAIPWDFIHIWLKLMSKRG